MRDFAKPYIEQTTGQYIGFSTEDIEALSKPLTAMAEAITDLHNRASEFDAAGTELLDYATEALMQRRSAPTDDVIGYIATKIESGAVDELFAANLVVTLLSAGLEPTILQMGILLQELSSLPDVWDEIASSPKRTPLVLEELLRLRSTNQGVVRCVYEDTEQHTMQFQKGTNVIVEIGKANHDPRRFPQPDEFNIQANKGAHLAFGFGPHHCLGAPLVRAQLQESLEVMAFILSCPRIIGVRSKTGQGLSGPLELTVEMESRTYPLGAEN
jgi:cytochrome P450